MAGQLHHHPTGGGRRVYGLGQASKPRISGVDLLQDVQQVFEGARQAVELPNHDDVTGAKLVEKSMQLGRSHRPPEAFSWKTAVEPRRPRG